MMTRRVTPALPVALRLRPCASLFPTLFYRHCPSRVLVSRQTLVLPVLRSYGPHLCLKLIRYLVALCHHFPDEDGR